MKWDKRHNNCLIGLTGGIASGKSTVASLFEELGAYIIDSDSIARQVVEPGKLAWKEVVDCFGKKVLQKDGTLNRKRLSEIIFSDVEKRKKLERITHPRIHEEFVKQVDQIAEKYPAAIILVDIPLLFELNFRDRFYKVMLVYVPREKQIERLVARDGISEEKAAHMLKAQMPINDKVGKADFVIHNEYSLKDTKKQVVEVWKELKNIQKARSIKKKEL